MLVVLAAPPMEDTGRSWLDKGLVHKAETALGLLHRSDLDSLGLTASNETLKI